VTSNKLINAFSSAWQRSFDYTGRSDRGAYWWFVLANVIISVVLLIASNISNFFGWIYSIWTVATIVPSLSLTVRRLRDAGKHWAWMFIHLIPLVGFIWITYLLVQPSVAG
jgi:uncharacterized membrane protein YhaH (DUF805 family)